MKVMKLLFIVMLVMGVASIASARELKEVGETVLDTLTGDNQDCPMLTSFYIAKTIKDKIDLPLLGKCNWRTKLSYTSSIRQLNTENYVELETGLEF